MTISVRLDPESTAKLDALARQTGRSKSDLLRDCLRQYLEKYANQPTPYELGKHLFGRVASGQPDLAEQHSRLIKEKLRERAHRHRRRPADRADGSQPKAS